MKIPLHPLQEFSLIQFNIERIDHVNHYNPRHFHRHDYFEIFLFREGGGIHHIDFGALSIESGSIHFVTPGQVHLLERAVKSSGFVILFSADFFAITPENNDFLFQYPLFYHKTGTPSLILPPEEFAQLINYVEAMIGELNNQNSQRKRILQSYLHIFLYRCQHWIEKQHGSEKTTGPSLCLQLQISIEKHYKQLHQVADYAKLLFVTARQLNSAAQKHVGKHVAQLVQERLLIEAKRLLSFTDRQVGDIADSLGFEDLAHFSKFFKRLTGLSPTEWRQKQHFANP